MCRSAVKVGSVDSAFGVWFARLQVARVECDGLLP